MNLLDKLSEIKIKWEEIGKQLIDPNTIKDMKLFTKLNKEYKDLQPIIDIYDKYVDLLENIETTKEILQTDDDPEMKDMAKEELDNLNKNIGKIEEQVKILLIPKDPIDDKNAIVEIRAGTGGDEAGIFAGDIFKMYQKFAENNRWKIDIIDFNPASNGGYKEIIFNIEGSGVYGLMKYESGVHRVQRVPKTETQGRVHTSAISVVVLPQAEDLDVEIKESDIRKDTFCSSGPGGQSVNTTYSAIRLTHIPTGIVAQCQDQKSQIKNYDKALKVLKSRIFEIEMQKRNQELSSKRKTMVSTGDRSAKIRTYNFQQGRITDHRINLSLYNLENMLAGDILEMIEAIQMAENLEKMKDI